MYLFKEWNNKNKIPVYFFFFSFPVLNFTFVNLFKISNTELFNIN